MSNLLSLANTSGIITCKGTNNEKDSVIDLAWFKATVINEATFFNLQVDWEGSLGSNHAALHVMARTSDPTRLPPNLEMDPGYLIKDGAKQKWIETLQHILARQVALTPTAGLSHEEVECAALKLELDINEATASTCKKCHPFHPKAAPWWNDACSVAASQLKLARGAQTKKTAAGQLKGTVQMAR